MSCINCDKDGICTNRCVSSTSVNKYLTGGNSAHSSKHVADDSAHKKTSAKAGEDSINIVVN